MRELSRNNALECRRRQRRSNDGGSGSGAVELHFDFVPVCTCGTKWILTDTINVCFAVVVIVYCNCCEWPSAIGNP